MDDRVVECGSGFGKKLRKVTVVVGNRYRIEPLNPLRMKNRGRICEVTGFRDYGPKRGLYANVIWLDTGKSGWTDMSGFVQLVVDNPATAAT